MSLKKIVKKLLPNNFYMGLKTLSQVGQPFPYRKYTKKYKCIFIHIPKTAGTSILTILAGNRVFRDHASYYDFQRADLVKFESYFKFCFVRNPYDRAVSCYEYLKCGGNQMDDLYFKELIENKYPTFEKFILEYLDKDIIHEHVLFKPQYTFVYDCKNQCHIDYIAKYESIDKDFEVICKNLKISVPLPKINGVDRVSYKNYYTNNLIEEKIHFLYRKDFILFNYSIFINK